MNALKLRRTFRDIIQLLVTTTAVNQTYTIPSGSGVFEPTVDWGDGTVQALSGVGDVNKTHTYAVAGAYTVTIRGKVENIHTYATVSSAFLTKVLQVRSKSLLTFAFFNCSTLNEICPLIAPNLTNCENMFFLCPSLTSIPASLFTNAPKVTTLRNGFNSTGVTSVPSGLLDTLTMLNSTEACFQNTPISSGLPAGLLTNNTLLTNASGMFVSCTSLPSLPSATFFSTNTALTTIADIFGNCTSMTGVLAGIMFNTNTLLTNINGLFTSSLISGAIPNGLFANQSLVTSAIGTFAECANIMSLPANCFSNMPLITTFLRCLKNTSISSVSAAQFTSNTVVTDFSNVLNGTDLTSVPAGLFSANTAVLNFDLALYGTSSLPLVPSTIFNAATLCRSYDYSFTENGGMSAADIDALLIQIDTINVATGASLTFDYAFGNPLLPPVSDASRSAPALAAISNLLARGWTRGLVY